MGGYAFPRQGAQAVSTLPFLGIGETTDPVIEPYPKTGGQVLTFDIPLRAQDWNDGVVEILALGQRISYGWELAGDVLRDISGWSNASTVPGIVSMQWTLLPTRNDEMPPADPDEGPSTRLPTGRKPS